jgi:hypothetical protein
MSGTAATNTPIVHAPDDIRLNMKQQWNNSNRKNQRTQRKTCLSATLFTTNLTWTALAADPTTSSCNLRLTVAYVLKLTSVLKLSGTSMLRLHVSEC